MDKIEQVSQSAVAVYALTFKKFIKQYFNYMKYQTSSKINKMVISPKYFHKYNTDDNLNIIIDSN